MQLPVAREVAKVPLPEAMEKPSEPLSHEHEDMEFNEPENTAGDVQLGHAKRRLRYPKLQASSAAGAPPDSPVPSRVLVLRLVSVAVYEGAAAMAQVQKQSKTASSDESGPSTSGTAISMPATARTTNWYRMKAQIEDCERAERGEAPKKRNQKRKEFYACGKCGKPKTKETSHTQYKGRWYCPHDPQAIPYEQWKANIMADIAKKKS